MHIQLLLKNSATIINPPYWQLLYGDESWEIPLLGKEVWEYPKKEDGTLYLKKVPVLEIQGEK